MANVLVIDDEPGVCDVLVALLAQSGHEAAAAALVVRALAGNAGRGAT
jgi:CheY-like chemotaxis protein